jgi:hypothetical protein
MKKNENEWFIIRMVKRESGNDSESIILYEDEEPRVLIEKTNLI